MHELAVTQSILETALHHIQEAKPGGGITLCLVLGEMSEVTEESVRFYWEEISRGTTAEGARLSFRHAPAELACLNCDERYAPAGEVTACPICGSEKIKVVAGEGFYLEAIEIE
jgi:hydrogenase nickel incorporation protein HypA/HybF